ncbi:MAG TPA: glycoside hydrolase family 28 protein, partial [Bacteroidales bacterium]|nr:glycoside hydrolase family 28 protein [Bacteroidales bacterium]
FTIIIIIFIQGISVYLSSPYYFNYQNIFLPQKFVLTDSWSYGIFEATQYLNSLPDARNMTIWSDRKAACYYFVGNCIMSRKIDANKQLPDYFIVTRRGVLRHHFKWSDIFTAPYSVDTIYSDKILSNPLWQFNILDRRENYIKIIDAHNLSDLSFVDDVENMPRPIFPDTICNITNFGAQSTLTRKQIDAKEDVAIIDNEKKENAQAFEEAIRECSEKGGGTIEVPSGLWYTKAIHLKNNINLHLSKDATILFSDDPDDFLPVVKTRFIGLDVYNYSPMIYVQNAQNIAITGTGTIDGNGKTPIWDSFIGNQKKPIRKLYNMSLNNVPIEDRVFGTIEDALRPSLIQFYNSKNILIDGIKIIGGPMWTIHPVYSKNIIIQNTDIKTLASNGDGIAIDSSENILIKNNILSTTDDAIVIKSGRDEDGWTQNKPSQNIVIRDNVVTHAHAGVGFGSEMSAGIQNVFVDNMQISNADRGFRLKTTLGRGGFIKNITIQNSTIINPGIKDALSLNMNYGSSTIKPKTKKIPEFKNISFKNITITMTQKTNYHDIIIVDGIKNNLSHILFDNIKTNDENATTTIKNSEQIRFNNVKNANYFIKNSKDIIIINDRCSAITQKNSKNISHLCEE